MKKTLRSSTSGKKAVVKTAKRPVFTKRFAQIRSRHPTHNILRRNKALLFDTLVVIRLGSTTPFNGRVIELNSVQSVKNCSDKMRMKNLFKEAKLMSPVFFTLDEMSKQKNVKFPIIKKIRFRSRGNGMVYIENQQELDEQIKINKGDTNVYFEEYFDGCREYRMHVSVLGCFYTCRKVRKVDAEDRWYFNSLNSSWLLENNPKYNKPKTYDQIITECQKGLKALDLDFGAFDVRVKKDGSFVILEANSAPSFGDTTAQRYLEHIPKLVNLKKQNA